MIGIGTVIKPGNENKTRNGSLKLVKSNILCSFLKFDIGNYSPPSSNHTRIRQ